MENIKSSELRAPTAVGKGSTQLLSETYIKLKPPMLKILNETWDAKVTDYTVLGEDVLVKGLVEHTFHYLHPHGKKSQSEQKEDGNKRESEQAEQTDEFKVLNGWGGLVEFSSGIIHFHQQVFEFKGTVSLGGSGLMASDTITPVAKITDFDVFNAADIADNGLINGGSQTFKIDISLVATREV